MGAIFKKISMFVTAFVVAGMLIGSVQAEAASSWSFASGSSNLKVDVNDTVIFEKGEYQDMNLYKNGSLIKDKNDKTYKVVWSSSDNNVVFVDKSNGKMRADKYGKMKGDLATAKITATITNIKDGASTKKSFMVQVVSKKSTLPSGVSVLENLDPSIQVYSINGGVVLAKKDNLFGAMNKDGKVIVPFEYLDIVYYPTESGYFALLANETYMVKIFDKTGENVKSIEYHGDAGLQISGDKAFWRPDMYGYEWYDLKNKEGGYGSNYIEGYYAGGYGRIIKAGDRVLEGRWLYNETDFTGEVAVIMDFNGYNTGQGLVLANYLGTLYDLYNIWNSYDENVLIRYEENGIGLVDVTSGNKNGAVADTAKGKTTFDLKLVKPSQIFAQYTGFETMKDGKPVEWEYGYRGTRDDGVYKYSVDEQIAMWFTVGEETVELLLNFKDAIVDEDGYVINLDDIVKGRFDRVELGENGVHIVRKGAEEFFIDSNGKRINDYNEVCAFNTSGYAAVVKEDGKVYLIDSKFNEIATGYDKADYVDTAGEAIVIKCGDIYRFLIFE